MVKKRGKEIYQPPYAQDLSGLGAIGQVKPMGQCASGTDPKGELFGCVVGDLVTTEACPMGNFPGVAGCETGSDVFYANHCATGTNVT